MSQTILYADDEERFHKLVKIFLSEEDYHVICFTKGEDLLDYLYDNRADLVILDIMMPGMDGWETCREIRKDFSIPILMLTALNDESHEVEGIKTGADDYIGKPFSQKRLVARVNNLLKRVKRIETSQSSEEGILFNEMEHGLIVDNNKIPLSPKEYALIKYLLLNKDQVLSREQLLNHIWGFDYDGDPRTVDTHIKSLRANMGTLSSKIVTVRGKGYAYKGEVL